MKNAIIKMLDEVDERKIRLIYFFVRAFLGGADNDK